MPGRVVSGPLTIVTMTEAFVSSANQRSTRFSQEPYIGVKST